MKSLRLLLALPLLILTPVVSAGDFLSETVGEEFVYRSTSGQTVVSRITHAHGQWRYWENFAGLGNFWVYSYDTSNWFWLYAPGSGLTLIPTLDAPLGYVRDVQLFPNQAGPLRVTVAARTSTTPIEIRLDVEYPNAAGVTAIWFGSGRAGILRWQQETPSGRVEFRLQPSGGVQPPPQVGSRFWYEQDAFGNPFKTHSANEILLAQEVFVLVNQERARRGLAPLRYDVQAERAALIHSEDMAGRGFFAHNTPEGWDAEDRLQMSGAQGYASWAENLSLGRSSAQAVVDGWMSSSGHRANILNSRLTHIGVGIEEGSRIWTQVFLRR